MGTSVEKWLGTLAAGTALLAAVPGRTEAAPRVLGGPAGRPPAHVLVRMSPRCFVYRHHRRANIAIKGLRSRQEVSLAWAVNAPHSSGPIGLGPGPELADVRGTVRVSYPAPTAYFSDINHWVLTVLDLRNHPLASVDFRVVEGHPSYLPPSGPSQSCP